MPEPIVFISHFKVKQGKVGGSKRLSAEVIPQLHTEKTPHV